MKYEFWPDETEAKLVEDLLVEELSAISQFSDRKRETYYTDLFHGIKQHLNLSDIRDEGVVLRNINPFLRLFNEGKHAILLKLTKDRLPLSSDGYVCATKIHVPRLPYYVSSSELPCTETSIARLGNQSPLLSISKISDFNLLAKGYDDLKRYRLYEALRKQFEDPAFDFSNMFVWGDRSIGSEILAMSFANQSGVGPLMQMASFFQNDQVDNAIQIIKDDPLRKNRLELLNALLTNKETKSYIFINLFYRRDDQVGQGEEHLDLILNRVKIASRVIAEGLGKDLADVRMSLIETAQGLILDHADREGLGMRLKTLLTPEEIKSRVKPNKAIELGRFLVMPELLAKASFKHKAKLLDDQLGL